MSTRATRRSTQSRLWDLGYWIEDLQHGFRRQGADLSRRSAQFLLFLVTVVWLIAAAHLGLVSWTMVAARRVQNLRDDLARLQRDNAILEHRVAQMESVSYLLAEAEAEGFVFPTRVEFVESR